MRSTDYDHHRNFNQTTKRKEDVNAIELFHKDGRSAGVWHCEKCRIVAPSQEQAEACCRPYKCTGCGAECERYHTLCRVCVEAKQEQQERERFDKAEKLTEWDGWVYSDGRGFQDGYFDSLDDFMEFVLEEGIEPPNYVWACKSEAFACIDVDHVLEHIEQNGYDDFDSDTLKGIPELKAALNAFTEANKDVLSYTPDYSTAVLLTQPNDMAEGSNPATKGLNEH